MGHSPDKNMWMIGKPQRGLTSLLMHSSYKSSTLVHMYIEGLVELCGISNADDIISLTESTGDTRNQHQTLDTTRTFKHKSNKHNS